MIFENKRAGGGVVLEHIYPCKDNEARNYKLDGGYRAQFKSVKKGLFPYLKKHESGKKSLISSKTIR